MPIIMTGKRFQSDTTGSFGSLIHYDSTQETSNYSSGDPVDTLSDQTGNGYDARDVQSVWGNSNLNLNRRTEPLFQQDSNNVWGLRFGQVVSGSAATLSFPDVPIYSGNDFSVSVVVSPLGAPSDDRPNTDGIISTRHVADNWADPNGYAMLFDGPNDQVSINNSGDTIHASDVPFGDYEIYTYVHDSSNVMNFYKGGTSVGTLNSSTVGEGFSHVPFLGIFYLDIGGWELVYYFDGMIYEVFYWDYTIDSTTVSDINDYFTNKYPV